MKIGIFSDTYTPDINGVVSSVITLQNELEAQGHEVYVITSHKSLIHSVREGNIFRIPGLELKWLYGYILSTPYHFSVKTEIEKLNLDIIHVHSEFGVGVFGRTVAKLLNIPVVCTYHTMYEDYTNYINRLNLEMMEPVSKKIMIKFSKLMCESVANIISPSEKTKAVLLSYGIRRPIYIIPTGIKLDLFNPKAVNHDKVKLIKEKFNITEDKVVITYLGRIAPEKSIDFLIEGFKDVTSDRALLMIVGAGPSEDELKERVNQLGMQDKVIFVGKVERDEVPSYYAASNAFASASKTETQGMTYIEALASGLCVFAAHDECVEELVYEDKTGYYIDSPEEFARKVDAFVQKENSKETMQEACVQVVQKYDVHKFASNIVQVYEKAIDDFTFSYNVKMIKTSNDNMKIYLENEKMESQETLLVSIDDYMFYQIKKGNVIEKFIYDVLKDKERILTARIMSYKYLRTKDRTRKEMYDYLIGLEEVSLTIKEVNDLIEQLEEKGYINDKAYLLMNIDILHHKAFGKRKILRKMVEKGIPYDDVEHALLSINDSEEMVIAQKKASKYMLMIQNKSVQNKKQSIVEKLVVDGFNRTLAKEIVNELNFEEDYLKEALNLDVIVEKAYKNYSRKHKDSVLKNKVIAYCLIKGFLYDDIKCVIAQKENDYEVD